MTQERAKAQVAKASAAVTQFLADLEKEAQQSKQAGQSSQPIMINIKLLQ